MNPDKLIKRTGGRMIYQCKECHREYWLWRKSSEPADTPLLCGACLRKKGYTQQGTQMVRRNFATYVPAIRTPDGTGFYVYTAIPDEAYLRWLVEDIRDEEETNEH